MTSELNLPAPTSVSRDEARDFNYARKLWAWFLAPPPSLLPDEWAESEPVRFNYSQSLQGPCDFTGRNYLRRPIRDAADPKVRKQKKIFGRGNGKTLIGEVKKCYKLKFAPGTMGAVIWPGSQGEGSSAQYVNKRFSKTIKATKCLNDLIPAGQERFYINAKKVVLNGSYYGFFGAHSGGKVGDRLNDIDFDEIEKYPPTLKNEGSIINLIEGSTKGVAEFQIDYSSTPTIEEGLMWQAIQKSNLHLYFVPCPHCSSLAKNKTELNATKSLSRDHAKLIHAIHPRKKNSALQEEDRRLLAIADGFKGWFIILFSEDYAAGYPRKYVSQSEADQHLNGAEIPAATLNFRFPENSTKENPINDARGRDGTWNHARAMANAHLQCPHCKQAIRDYDPATNRVEPAQKIWMDAHGAWICVKPGEPGDYGYMINSLYAPVINLESTWGGYACEFISAWEERGEAVRTFVNAILAGVYTNQNNAQKIEVGSTPLAQPDWVSLLTADFHKNHPYIWFVVRKWCAFKLLPPFAITDGKPAFVPLLDLPGNEVPKKNCLALVNNFPPAWNALAELMRFDSQTGQSPLVDFLLAQKIAGDRLVKLFREDAGGNTMDFRKKIYELMAQHAGQTGPVRPPRGGDSELLAAGHLDLSGEALWEELRDVIKEFKVGEGFPAHKKCVAIDAGYQERFQREVLEVCYASGKHLQWYDPMSKNSPPTFHGFWEVGKPSSPAKHGYCQPCPADGWQALRGIPTNRPLGDGKMNRELSIRVEDPFYGTAAAGSKVVPVLHVPQGLFWLRKDDLQKKRTKNLHTVAPNVSWFPKLYGADGARLAESRFKAQDYERQINEQYYNETKKTVEPRHGRGGSQNKRHPYHLDDCETYQVALATWHEFFQVGEQKT